MIKFTDFVYDEEFGYGEDNNHSLAINNNGSAWCRIYVEAGFIHYKFWGPDSIVNLYCQLSDFASGSCLGHKNSGECKHLSGKTYEPVGLLDEKI